ncbi:MAG: type II toxin-antitoxin system Phd/YefM family antitoxin [Actinomycetes bacterium]
MSVSKAKATLDEVARQVASEHDRVYLTRNGVADTVLISAEDLDALEMTVQLLGDPVAMAALAHAAAEPEGISSDDMASLMRQRRQPGA